MISRFNAFVKKALPSREMGLFIPLYAWLSFLDYCIKLWLTPSWFTQLALNHEALLRFEYTNNEQSRLLQFYIPELFQRVLGTTTPHSYALARLLFVFLTFVCFHRFLRKWFSVGEAAAGVLLLAAILPFTFMNDLQESSSLLMLLFLLALQAIRDHRVVPMLVLFFLGGLTNETMMILPGVYFLYHADFNRYRKTPVLILKSFLIALPLFLTLGPIRYLNRNRPVLGGGFHWPDNLEGIFSALSYNPLDFPQAKYTLFWILLALPCYYAACAYKELPLFLKRSFWIIPIFVLAHLVTGKIDEPRQMVPLFFILIPILFFVLVRGTGGTTEDQAATVSRFPFKDLVSWGDRHVLLLAGVILWSTMLPFLFGLNDSAQSDVKLYEGVAADLQQGVVPYRNRVLEYPPYSIPIFVAPALFKALDYSFVFQLFACAADVCIKCLLLAIGLRSNSGLKALLPLVYYSVGVLCLRYFYLQRYDVFAALAAFAAVAAFSSKKTMLAGFLLAIATGLKLYPVILFPALAVICWRNQGLKRFLAGAALGVLPLGILSFRFPWWNFLDYHSQRGIQVESLYASALWLLHLAGVTSFNWEQGHGCLELHGSLATHVLPWARALFFLMVIVSIVWACRVASRRRAFSAAFLSRLSLLPLSAFVAFNQVLSPQYLIWLLPFAGLASLEGKQRVAVIMLLATCLTPMVFPSEYYHTGLHLPETIMLLIRNLALIWLWWRIAAELAEAKVEAWTPSETGLIVSS
jgi:Gpi18-like mannosyltransferase